MIISVEDIPGYREAIAEEARERERNFIGFSHDICGVKVRSMTVLDFIVLDSMESAFIKRTIPTLGDLTKFLWYLSIDFDSLPAGLRRSWAAFRFGRRVRRLDVVDAAVRGFAYVDAMFADMPGGKDGGEPFASWLAVWTDLIRSEYKCSRDDVLSMTLPEFFQSVRCIHKRANPKTAFANRKADAICDGFMRGLNDGSILLQ